MFLGRNFRAVFDIWSSPGAFFFCSFFIILAIVPGVVNIFEEVILIFLISCVLFSTISFGGSGLGVN